MVSVLVCEAGDLTAGETPVPIPNTEKIPRCARDFGCGLPVGFASLTPAKRLKLSPAGPIVLHAKVCGRV